MRPLFRRRVLVAATVTLCLLPLPSASAHTSHTGIPVTFLGGWGSKLKTDFQAVLTYCDTHYNTNATYQQASDGDVNTALRIRVQGGNPPDLASLTTPSEIQAYVTGKSLKPITWLNRSRFTRQYSPFWRRLGTFNGKLYTIYVKADVKSLVWYSPRKFKAGKYVKPKTWIQLVGLSNVMVKQGKQPWAFGVGGSSFFSAWTLTDFLENIFLSAYGPAEYIKWYQHTIPWTGTEVKHVFQLANSIVANNRMIAGGRQRALSQSWDDAARQVVNDPRAEFFQEASFVGLGLALELPKSRAGKDYSVFPFPMIKKWPTPPVEVGQVGVVAFNDNPGTRALVSCLTDPKALRQWVRRGGYIAPNNAVHASEYPDAILRTSAKLLDKAGRANLVVGDASDLMPNALGNDYELIELQKWFKDPGSTDAILRELEARAKQVYK